jgi:hypothetical protein
VKPGCILSHHDHQVGLLAFGDEGLLPVDDVRVAVAYGGGAYPGQVRAGTRLAHRDGGDDLAGAEAGQPPLALVLGGQVGEVRPDDVVVQAEAQTAGAGGDDLLDQHRVEPEVGLPSPAILRGHVHAQQPGRARLAPDVAVDDAVALPLFVMRHRLPCQELPAQRPELVVDRLIQVLLHAASLPVRRTGDANGRFSPGARTGDPGQVNDQTLHRVGSRPAALSRMLGNIIKIA